MKVRRVLVFAVRCVLVFVLSGTGVAVLSDLVRHNIDYDSLWDFLSSRPSIYESGGAFLIAYLLTLLAGKTRTSLEAQPAEAASKTGAKLLNYLFHRLPAGVSLRDSGYEVLNLRSPPLSLYKKAKHELIVCGQNLHYLANVNFGKLQDMANELKLMRTKPVSIRFLINDVEHLESAIAWEAVCSGTQFQKEGYKPLSKNELLSSGFYRQLISATRNLHTLRKGFPDTVHIYTMPLVPTSITFVDPREPTGFLVIVPNFYEPKNTGRPYYVVKRKRNPNMFKQYWDAYVKITENSERSGGGVSELGEVLEGSCTSTVGRTTFVFVDATKENLKDIALSASCS